MLFHGELECTMDDKGRIKMPSSLRRHFPAEDGNRFMIAKDIEDCLVIYPMKTWAGQQERLNRLNYFNTQHRKFINAITVGLTEVEMDSADRFLISKSLQKYLGSAKNIILKGTGDRVQLWDAGKYEQYTQGNIAHIQPLADEVAQYLDSLEQKDK